MTRITRVLCPVDFSETSQHALDHAAAIAGWYEAQLTILYVFANVPTMDLPPLVLEDADRARLMTSLKEMAHRVPATVRTDFSIQEAPFVHDEVLAQIAATHADCSSSARTGAQGFSASSSVR
jgi:nucleotide-binding universal stress UspA family protein